MADGLVFDIDTFAVHDGPGIRMAVYLKGCQLACKWCHSPESIRPEPELIFIRDRCVQCGACAQICPQSVHSTTDRDHTLDREKCLACGQCVNACPTGALAIKGYRVPATEIVQRAVRTKPFFDHSGGGITLTGGEVTCQVEFAEALLKGCRDQGVHTTIETNGACAWERLQRLLPHSDLILYDIKLIDDAEHRRWTGASNRLTLENAARLKDLKVQVRVPLIPEITDTDENLQGIFSFMASVGLSSVGLLPFNPSTSAKYEWLCLSCEIDGVPQTPQRLQRMLALASQAGLEAVLG